MANISLELTTFWENAMYTVSANERPRALFGRFDGEENTKRKAVITSSWAQVFREQVFPYLPGLEAAKKLYRHNNGRPSKDVNVSIGLLIIQEFFNLTDQETVERLIGDEFVQHAIYIDNPTDDNAYMSRRAFWSFKEKVWENKLDELIFK
jgi:hypothetical protein